MDKYQATAIECAQIRNRYALLGWHRVRRSYTGDWLGVRLGAQWPASWGDWHFLAPNDATALTSLGIRANRV